MRSVLERIESVPGNCTLGKELSASPITKIYLCVFNNIKSIIRFDLEAASHLALDRLNEVSILQSINHLDLAQKFSILMLKQVFQFGSTLWEQSQIFLKTNQSKIHYMI